VVEAGASVPGEIGRLREIIAPDVAVVTNVAAGHLEGFATLQAVLEEKASLAEGVGLAVVGVDPVALPGAVASRARRVVTAGLSGADVTPEGPVEPVEGYAVVQFDGRRFRLPLLGLHQAANAALAWAVGRELDLDFDAMADALSQVTIPGGRGQVRQIGTLTVLDDCYNANPASFRTAMATARSLRDGGKGRPLVFVAGTMLELGPDADRLHREVAEELVALDPDLLVAVGAFGAALTPWADRLGERLLVATDAMAAADDLRARLSGDELLVLKASRGVGLERILPRLVPNPDPDAEA